MDHEQLMTELFELEAQLDRQYVRVCALVREAGELAGKLSEIREALCSVLVELKEEKTE